MNIAHMGERKADKHFGLFFCTLAIAGVIFIAFALGLERGYRLEHDEQQSKYSEQQAQSDIARSCAGSVQCIGERIKATDDAARSEREVDAQEGSTWWARWAGIVALLTFGTTAVGLWFLKGTLDATREAVQDTAKATEAIERQNKLTEAAQRAWIDIRLEVFTFEIVGNLVDIVFEVVFTNIGKSIAESVWTYVHPGFFGKDCHPEISQFYETWWHEHKGPSSRALMPGESFRHLSALTHSLSEIPWYGDKSRRANAIIVASAHYNVGGVVGFDGKKRTDRAFRLGLADDDPLFEINIWEDRLKTVKAEEVKIRKIGVTNTS